MNDLAIIQTEESIKQIRQLIQEGKPLITMVQDITSSVEAMNKSFNPAKAKEYAEGLKNITAASRNFNDLQKQITAANERMSRIERNNAQATAETARARYENAKAANSEAKAIRDQQRATEVNTSAYKRLSQEGNKVKLVAKNLEAEILILTRDFKTGVITQEQYNKELAKLQGGFAGVIGRAKELDAQLKKIDASVGDRQRNVGNYRDAAAGSITALDKQIKSMISLYLGFHAVVNGTRSLIHNNYELSDSLADLQIRLNGNKEAADKLFESLKQIDTRTSLGELVNTASIVAKKGVAADEIEGITKALDDYFVVAGKEAGSREEGTASIIKLISIFNEDKHVTAERVTEVGTALVKLSNSGVATTSKMIDVAERIGAIRGITGITLPQVLGFAAAIEQLGQRSEVAGTAGMQILTKMLSDMPKYAKLAGISVKELRKTYNDNPFEAVVKVSEGVIKSGDYERISQDLEEVGVKGARVKGVLGDIAGNAEFVRKRLKDASLAINEEGYLSDAAAKKQETFAATLDKVKKQFELVGSSDGFRNFINESSRVVLGFIKILTAIPFGVVITGITLLTAAWAYYKGSVIQATIAAQWNNSQSLLGIVRNKAARLGLLGETEAIRANTIAQEANTMVKSLNVASLETQIAAERAAIVSLAAKTAANEAEVVAIAEQIAAKEALIIALEAEIVATNEATVATTGLNTATKISPLGIVLGVLALLVPLMLTFADNTEKAAKKTRTLAENQEDLNKALDKGVQNAAEEVSHLDELYKKYTNVNTPMKEKKEILKEWQDYYPSYFGSLKTEKDLNDKLSASYTELREAIVSAARADAIRDKLKGRTSERLSRDEQLTRETQKETELNKKLNAQTAVTPVRRERVDGGDGKSFTIEYSTNDLLVASNKRLSNLAVLKKNNEKADAEEDKILLDMAVKEDARTEKLRKDRASRLGKFAKPEDPEKEKKYTGAKLDGYQKDRIMILEAERDNELAINESKYIDGKQSEVQYLKESLRINTEFFDKKIAYLKGSDAKEKSIVAKAELDKKKTLKEFIKKIYDIESKDLEENNKKKINLLERASKDLDNSEFLTNTERLDQQIALDGKMIDQLTSYYFNQIELAKDAGEKVLEIERKRDEEIGKIQDSRSVKFQSKFEAIIKDYERQTDIDTANSNKSYEEQKSLILSDKKLSNAEKEYRVTLLDIDKQIEANKIKIKNLEIDKAQYDLKIAMASLEDKRNPEAEKTSAQIGEQIQDLKNANIELNKQAKDAISDKEQSIRDNISEGFKNLGFEHLADAYTKTMDRLKKDTASWKDYAVLAATAVLDALSNLTDAQKEKTISALDEQLKASQDISEQEVNFLQSRIDAINALGDLNQDQINERSRLESEALAEKEQQRQREKMIETQKARAEQKAASNQALINGALAATMTLAQLGIPAGIVPAALALAFGIAQSVSIMSKDPTPQYWKGRNNGPAEWADTQERGREIITNTEGDVINQGSATGSKRTWLNEGDRVFTADQSRKIIKDFGGIPKIGQNIFRKAALRSLKAPSFTMINHSNNVHIDENKLATAIGKSVDASFKRHTNPSTRKKNGFIIEDNGANVSVIMGEYNIKTGEETWY